MVKYSDPPSLLSTRATTSVHQTTCPSTTESGWGVSRSLWSTPPCWLTWGASEVTPPANSPTGQHLRGSKDLWMTLCSLPSLLRKKVRCEELLCYNLKSWFIVESSWNWMFPTKPLVHLDEHQQWVCLLYSRMCSLPKKEILIHCSGATLVVENSPTFAPWCLPSFMQSYGKKLDENLEMTLNQFHSSPQFVCLRANLV